MADHLRAFEHGFEAAMSSEHIRVYNGPKPSKKCSGCAAVIAIGDRYWRGIDGLTRACLSCGSRIRGERTYAAVRAQEQQRAEQTVDRRRYRDDRRAAILRGDTLA